MTPRVCVHCNTLYYAKDKRRLYCTSSCNTLAWKARQGDQSEKKAPANSSAQGELEYSFNNIATVATGSLVADGVKALFDNSPTTQEIMARLANLEKQLGELTTIRKQLRMINVNQVDQIKAEMLKDPDFRLAHGIVQQKRLENSKGLDSLALDNPQTEPKKSSGR